MWYVDVEYIAEVIDILNKRVMFGEVTKLEGLVIELLMRNKLIPNKEY
ncbi:hypothetical protein [Vibrio phage JSF12]|uniref:Uncharacterized protein n=2 Tax=Jesfedecavirus TaxID=2560156 RepID=A0A2D0YX79_9CAUD|nr:hypothetical protein FDI98_gp128 [Vibrio phage JSF10]YP_009794708.1 hypothetical protein HOS35_gp025 [Vibrio phage JSF12]ASV43404.1 hypothetical protein [Vibrio phage JSF10]ASV43543.1 hypothetical protein [Vibrio phage JSF12]